MNTLADTPKKEPTVNLEQRRLESAVEELAMVLSQQTGLSEGGGAVHQTIGGNQKTGTYHYGYGNMDATQLDADSPIS